MRDIIQKELSLLPEKFIVAFIVPPNKHEKLNFALLNILTNKKNFQGCYITVNKPHKHLVGLLKKNKVNSKNLVFIDCITKNISRSAAVEGNCIFIDSPTNLTALGIAIKEVVDLMKPGQRFVFIDSLSSLLLHNSTAKVLKFFHFLSGKMRIWEIDGLMVSLHTETDKKLIAEIAEFCDKIIRL